MEEDQLNLREVHRVGGQRAGVDIPDTIPEEASPAEEASTAPSGSGRNRGDAHQVNGAFEASNLAENVLLKQIAFNAILQTGVLNVCINRK